MRRTAFLGAATACTIAPFASAALADSAPIPLVVAPPTGMDATGLYYALQQGWFQQAGLQVTVTPASGAAAIPAVIGGAVQIAYANVFSLCEAHQKRVPITLIAPGVLYTTDHAFQKLLVAADSPARGPKDFVGKTIGVGALGDMASFSVQAWLAQAGVDPTQVHFVELRVPSMPDALEAKRVDGISLYEPYVSAAIARGARVVAKPFDSIALSFLEAAWFATAAYAGAHRDAIAKFTGALNRGAQYYDKHYQELVPLIADYTKLAPDVFRKLTPVYVPPTISPAAIQPVIDSAAKYHVIDSSFPAKEFIFT